MRFVSVLLLVSACASSSESVKPEGAAKAGPSDPQIAAIVVAANEMDVAAAKQALEKTQNPQVKEFAELMVRDHEAVNRQAGALVQKLGVTPEENDTSKAIRQNGEATRNRLASLSGADFDRAYVNNEIDYHQFVISAMDGELIPSAKNEELEALLVQVRPAFQQHLEHARMVAKALGGAQP
jgi:putative membrane protein